MNITQPTAKRSPSGNLRCIRCNSVVPAHAQFCGTCGERVQKSESLTSTQENTTTKKHYDITSLVRRRPYVQLFFAVDTEHQRTVGIRDIDVSSLGDEARLQAMEALRQEYDLLRRQRIHDVMPVIDVYYHEGHICTVAGWPFPIQMTGTEDKATTRLYTLEDLLHSGVSVPDERVALTWSYRICRAVAQLHEHQIVLGDLDPSAVVVSENSYKGLPALMVSWLPLTVRALFPRPSDAPTPLPFSAPEALQGNVEPRSDIYSLGALLYLLLTGQAPTDARQRTEHPLRMPPEYNPHLSGSIDEVVMRALSIESADRFQSADEMADALMQLYVTTHQGRGPRRVFASSDRPLTGAAITETTAQPIDDPEDVTISIVPLRARLAQWYQAQQQSGSDAGVQEQSGQRGEDALSSLPPSEGEESALPSENRGSAEPSLAQRVQGRLSGWFPALSRLSRPGTIQKQKPRQAWQAGGREFFLRKWFEWLKRFLVGEQQHSITAAALIETPLRVQPNQGYTLRIHLTGRDEPTPPPQAESGAPLSGLSALAKGEIVHIEVRSALFQNYAYIVQQADVQLPGKGYAAEVIIPLQPLANGPNGRRDRLHIFFMDEMRRPLYDKPFVVELLISQLVQPGQEGYNVLTIPF